jgi:hypothetical protein
LETLLGSVGLVQITLQHLRGRTQSRNSLLLLKVFAGTPEGQKTMLNVLPQVLGGLNLPSGAADIIKAALPGQQ